MFFVTATSRKEPPIEEAIIIVEAVSNGRYYVQEALALGYLPVVVTPKGDFGESCRNLHACHHEQLKGSGALFFEEPESLGVLRNTLSRFNVRAVVAGVPLASQLSGLPGNSPRLTFRAACAIFNPP